MHPIICSIGPLNIYAYGVMLVGAFLVSSVLLIIQAKKNNFNPNTIFDLAFVVFISGIIGSRLFYITENIAYYIREPVEIFMLQHGGLSWFGGLVSGIFVGIVYLRNKDLPVYRVLDLIVPFLALAQAIGRVGCLLNGCCFGKVSESGIYFPVQQATLIPTQIYSSLALVIIFIFLRFLQDKPHREGTIFFTYLLLYSVKRFIIEFWRADNDIIFLGMTLFQIISVAVFCFSFFKFLLIIRSKR